MANTKPKTIRISDDLWDKAIRQAREEGTTLADMIRRWLEDYTSDDKTITDEMNIIMERLRQLRHRLAITYTNGELE